MGWRDLLQKEGETVTLPWCGGRRLRSSSRSWTIDGPLPPEHGWYLFSVTDQKVKVKDLADPDFTDVVENVVGYLVGDRIVPDGSRVDPDPKKTVANAARVFFLEPGLDRFSRIRAGRLFDDGPLVFIQQEMPLGPEEEVLNAFYEQLPSLDTVKGVAPALDAAFRMEVWQRDEAEKQRRELERLRREEEEKRAREEQRRRMIEQIGSAEGRREMAKVDFNEAAKAALALTGAVLLDVRDNKDRRGEKVVRFRLDQKRFECVCDARTLRIVDSGICLIDHTTNIKGDTWFTLESLPGVIRQAERERRLVVFRHP